MHNPVLEVPNVVIIALAAAFAISYLVPDMPWIPRGMGFVIVFGLICLLGIQGKPGVKH